MTQPRPTWRAWVNIECVDRWCGQDVHRVDLVLVRGLDHAGGRQVWHAMAPPDLHGTPILGGVSLETDGHLDHEQVHIEWPLQPCGEHARLVGAQSLAHTLS